MGTLGIPYAIKVGGMSSILYIVVVAIVTCYTSGLIIQSQYDDVASDADGGAGLRRIKSRAGFAAIGRYPRVFQDSLNCISNVFTTVQFSFFEFQKNHLLV